MIKTFSRTRLKVLFVTGVKQPAFVQIFIRDVLPVHALTTQVLRHLTSAGAPNLNRNMRALSCGLGFTLFGNAHRI